MLLLGLLIWLAFNVAFVALLLAHPPRRLTRSDARSEAPDAPPNASSRVA